MRPPGAVRRDLRLSLGDAAGYGAMAGVAEVYLPAFALALGMPPVLAGLVASVPLLAGGLLQLLAPRAIAKVTSLRRWVAACHAVQALAFVPLVVVALTGAAATPVVFGAAALYWAAGMAGAAGWTAWMGRVVPARIRARFFGRRQALVQATMLAGLIAAGAALHAADADGVRHVYAAMFGIATVARLGSALAVALQGRGLEATPRRRMRLRSIPPRLRGTPRAPLLAYLVAALAAAAVSGPFLTPFLLDQQGLDYAAYSVFTASIVIAKIVALPVLGKVIHRIGARRLLQICAIGIVPLPVLWAASGALPWLLAIQVYAGVVWAGFDLGMLMTLFDAEDDAERTTLQVAFSALQAIATAGASLLGGALLAHLGSDHDAYVGVFVASTAARLAAAVLLVRQLRALVLLPGVVVARAWTVAIRPWGGTILRPLVDGLERLGVSRRDRDDDRR